MSDSDDVIHLDLPDVIDLAEAREPTLLDVTRSSAVRRAAARAVHGLDSHEHHAPWVVVCTETREILATSPSYDPRTASDWQTHPDRIIRWTADGVPMMLVSLGAAPLTEGEPAYVAGELVVHALSEIVIAEHRAAEATARAGRAEALASTDALTGLANQRAWWNRIAEEDARIERSEGHAMVAVVDLDDLKKVNDERGHLSGDLLLRLTAQTLRNLVRSCDIVARVGGDEFAVLAVDYEGDPATLQTRIQAALQAADINASVGAALPREGATLVDAYDQADRAMYTRKRARRAQSATGA